MKAVSGVWSLVAAVSLVLLVHACGNDPGPKTETDTTTDTNPATNSDTGVDTSPPDSAVVDGTLPDVVLSTKVGASNATVLYDGVERHVIFVLPSNHDVTGAAPVLFWFHGGGGSAAGMLEKHPGLENRANQEGWILIVPQGVDNLANESSWAASEPVPEGEFGEPPDDEGFVLTLLALATAQLGADPDRVYATGFSKGGRLVHHLAAKHPDVFRAVAPVSTNIGSAFQNQPPIYYAASPTGPVPILTAHGTADPKLPIKGVANDAGEPIEASFQEEITQWVLANSCDPTPETTVSEDGKITSDHYGNCDTDATVIAVRVEGMKHVWPDADEAWNANQAVMDFLVAH